LDRGHKILAITNFPDAVERANLSHIDISGLKPHSKFKTSNNGLIKSITRIIGNANKYATILNHPKVAKLLQSGQKFDLVIAEFFTSTPIFAPIATVVDAPIVGFCPMFTFPWVNEVMGMDTTMSYMPNIVCSSTDRMSFFQRISNIVTSVIIEIGFNLIYTPVVRQLNKYHYGIQTESVINTMANLSLIMTNNYHSMFLPFPKLPGIVEVGGIHVVDKKPVPQVITKHSNIYY